MIREERATGKRGREGDSDHDWRRLMQRKGLQRLGRRAWVNLICLYLQTDFPHGLNITET